MQFHLNGFTIEDPDRFEPSPTGAIPLFSTLLVRLRLY